MIRTVSFRFEIVPAEKGDATTPPCPASLDVSDIAIDGRKKFVPMEVTMLARDMADAVQRWLKEEGR